MRLLTNWVPTVVALADIKVGDRVRAGAIGLATVKKTLTRDGKHLALLGKPGWVGGRLHDYTADTVTVFRPGTYIRFTTDDGAIEVADLTDPATEFEGDPGYTWATLCTTHSELTTHPTLALARRHAVDPAGWCEGHRKDTPHD